MTKKDYELLAGALRRTHPEDLDCYPETVWQNVCDEIAAVLKVDNSRFDVERFRQACRA